MLCNHDRCRMLLAVYIAVLTSVPLMAQSATGVPPFSTFQSGLIDSVNLGNLNVHLTIPIMSKAGRGIPFKYGLGWDSTIWSVVNAKWAPATNWGWRGVTEGLMGYITTSSSVGSMCKGIGATGQVVTTSGYIYHDASGTQHSFPGSSVDSTQCNPPVTPDHRDLHTTASDGSGIHLDVVLNGGWTSTVIFPSGVAIRPAGSAGGSGTITDTNGNYISASTFSGTTTFTDTMGQTVLTKTGSGTSASPLLYKYTNPQGTLSAVTLNYTNYNIKTNFGCAGTSEYTSTGSVPLVTSMVLPDQTQYTFTYENTSGVTGYKTGRLSSITLPAGGNIQYQYTLGAGCQQFNLTRILTPGGTWNYQNNITGSTSSTTLVFDPISNSAANENVSFQGIHETLRHIYVEGPNGALLETDTTCYNGNLVNCNTTAITLPITRKTVTRQLPSGKQSRIDTFYNSSGLITETDEYDWGPQAPGSVLRKTLMTYAVLSNSIVDRPASVVVQDGNAAVQSTTTYTYDEGAPIVTTGTPHLSPITGSRGNATTISGLVQGTTTLSKHLTYYDTGGVHSTTDINNATTTFNLADSSSTCGNTFPTSVSLPLALTRSTIWNCNAGVALSNSDENGQVVSTSYADPNFWRATSLSDETGNINSISYFGQTAFESSLVFNAGASITAVRQTVDGLGRATVQQAMRAPSAANYDSIETDYDSIGRVSKITMPYIAAAGALCSGTCPGSTVTYDTLGRVVTAQDGGGGSVTNTFTDNDVYSSRGPAPKKDAQYEYDALGRLVSVCEITTLLGSGTCAQSNPKAGYWTKYSYDAIGNLGSVTQNAQGTQSQTRNYVHDLLGRLTSESNPESGTTLYFYDNDPASIGVNCASIITWSAPYNWNPPYNGDLVKKYDANGNTTCYIYDALHRPLVIAHSGPNVTDNAFFVYDNAVVNAITMTLAKGRMAEAYTAACPTCSKITDLGFGYSKRGEPADVYESTPHSAGYYHVNASFWANGALNVLNGGASKLPGLPTITYGVDGEGRTSTVSASTGLPPVTSTSYNIASQVTDVTFGSVDTGHFDFDPNTGRMTQYKATINGASMHGDLTWNTNGTLAQLAITDPFNASDAQICNYGYDDLARLASANCGTAWSQTFAFDVFGNLSKSGSLQWLPGYDQATNRYSLAGTSYDANGDLLSDTFHTYTWDANGRPKTVDSIALTYDALGRNVENNKNGLLTQFVYAVGQKLALMSGQMLSKAFVSLPGGTQVKYDSSGISSYRVPNWLGSLPIGLNPSRTYSWGQAFAPYGERYAVSGGPAFTFTGQTSDTVSDEYDFLFRELHSSQGRWISPDPAGLGAVALSNPQSWNRYAYVGNTPLNSTDPTGLTCYSKESLGGGTCAIGITSDWILVDGVPTPAEFVSQNSEAFVNCPQCGQRQSLTYHGPNGDYTVAYTFTAGVNGSMWTMNGEELNSGDATELGLGNANDGKPANLPAGTPDKYWDPFRQGFNEAMKRLNKKKCGDKMFSGGGTPQRTLQLTEYRFLDLGNPEVGAQTNDSAWSVFINRNGPYMTYSPVAGSRPFGRYLTPTQMRGFILLHELGHQMSSITGFMSDANDSGVNRAQSEQVLQNCF
jgi:RHS repeat-associated protein